MQNFLNLKDSKEFPILKVKYHNELLITILNNQLYPSFLSKSIPDNLWALVDSQGLNIVQNEQIDICIPFDDLDIKPGEELAFFFMISNLSLRNTFMPKDSPLIIKRPLQ